MSQRKISFSFLFSFFLAVFSFLTLISSGSLDSEDGWLYASVARNIYYHHQVSAAPDEYPDLNVHMNSEKGSDGVWRAPGSLGYSLSLVPAVFLSDLVHQAYRVSPSQHFPLEHDWSFHLFASFTNAFYGAILAVVLLLYAQELHFSVKESVLISLLTLGTTSLLPLAKFSFAHMMFITFLITTFYFIKRFGRTQKIYYLFASAVTFLFLAISYNETFTLTVFPLGIYLLIHLTPKQRRIALLLAGVGFFCLLGMMTAIKSSFLDLILRTIKISPKILFEGVWGYLFSPGKSIFLYSPPLLIVPFFWHKMKRSIKPELIAASILTFCYLYVLGSASISKLGILQPIWHGGMNWGVRYISPLIPLWMFVVFDIFRSLRPLQKKLIVVPLFLLGAWIQLVGVSTSYLLQYIDLPYNFFIGKTEVLVYEYASFIPRYTPLYTLSKEFIKLTLDVPKTLITGKYHVEFFDGFDPPYKSGAGVLRGFRKEGHISFTQPSKDPIKISFALLNLPDIIKNQQPAKIVLLLNGQFLKEVILLPQKDQELQLIIPTEQLLLKNTIVFQVTYNQKLVSPQVIYIKKMMVDDTVVNLSSLDYPDMSNLGTATTMRSYEYSGKVITDQWAFWQMRARVNERTLDYWWVKNLYYWDRPVFFIWSFVALNVSAFVLSTFFTIKILFSKMD